MKHTFIEAVEHRRSCYSLGAAKAATEEEIVKTIDRLILCSPSAFNCQSSRVVILFGLHHICFWGIVKETLSEVVPPQDFDATCCKIDNSFAAGCGTVLFYEDKSTVNRLKENYPLYAENMDNYASQTSAMLQFAIWTALSDLGFGATLQHYNPLIDHRVAEQWNIDNNWQLMAQMPFGTPLTHPAAKNQHLPLSARRLLFSE